MTCGTAGQQIEVKTLPKRTCDTVGRRKGTETLPTKTLNSMVGCLLVKQLGGLAEKLVDGVAVAVDGFGRRWFFGRSLW